MTLKAVIQNGAIVPLEPLPPQWVEGQRVNVAEADEDELEPADAERLKREADEWFREMQEAAAKISSEDGDILMAAIAELRREGKEQMRKEMGLP